MSDTTYEENMNNLSELKNVVCEIDALQKLRKSDNPKIEFVNPIIDDNTQDTLVNVNSCVNLLCKLVIPGDSEHVELQLTPGQIHGIYLLQNCIENALDFEGWRSNIEKEQSAKSNLKEAV